MQQSDRVLCVLPLSFDYGLYQLLMSVRVGATLVLERGFAFPGRVVQLLEEERITGLPVRADGLPRPAVAARARRSGSSRTCATSRTRPRCSPRRRSRRFAAPSRTRACSPCTGSRSANARPTCRRSSSRSGRPRSVSRSPAPRRGSRTRTATCSARARSGELMIRGGHVMQGYWNDPEMTAERLRPGRWPWERVLATGDLFRADEDGFLYFVGRRDDLIKSGGEKVVPREIEEVLHSAPGVREAAVVGVADRLLGPGSARTCLAGAGCRARRRRAPPLLHGPPRGLQGPASRDGARRAAADRQRQGRSGRAHRTRCMTGLLLGDLELGVDEGEWGALAAETGNVFATPEWIATWWRHFGARPAAAADGLPPPRRRPRRRAPAIPLADASPARRALPGTRPRRRTRPHLPCGRPGRRRVGARAAARRAGRAAARGRQPARRGELERAPGRAHARAGRRAPC